MAGDLQPLDEKFAIVGPDGRPTLYFIKWAQQKQIDIQGSITAEQFNELLVEYLDAHALQEGSGIQITPSGSLNDSPTIAADVQEILDQITTTRGSVLYRNASDWVALAPGTAGHFLKTNGAGADPEWAVVAGGGAAWTEVAFWDFAVSGAVASVIADVTTYNEALVVFRDVTSVAAAIRAVQVSINAGVSYLTGAADYATINTAGAATGVNALNLHITTSTAARYATGLISTLRSNRATKPVLAYESSSPAQMIIGSSSPITHVRAVNWTGAALSNLNGGTVSIFAR